MQIGVHPVTAIPADINAVIAAHLGRQRPRPHRSRRAAGMRRRAAGGRRSAAHRRTAISTPGGSCVASPLRPIRNSSKMVEARPSGSTRGTRAKSLPVAEQCGRRLESPPEWISRMRCRVSSRPALVLGHQAGDLRQGVQRRAARAGRAGRRDRGAPGTAYRAAAGRPRAASPTGSGTSQPGARRWRSRTQISHSCCAPGCSEARYCSQLLRWAWRRKAVVPVCVIFYPLSGLETSSSSSRSR